MNRSLDFQSANLNASSIYRENAGLIRRIIDLNLKDEDQAEDAFQSFYLHLIMNPIPADVENLENYLYRTLLNFLAGFSQNKKRVQTYTSKYAGASSFINRQEDPRNKLINKEQASKLFTLVRKHLPFKESQAITLRYRDNCNFGEIAEIMAVKTISVRRYIVRGLQRLKSASVAKEMLYK